MKSTVLKPRDVYAALKIIAANSRRGPEAWPPFRAAAKAVLKVKKSDMPPSPFGKSGKKRKSQKPRRANQLFFSYAGATPPSPTFAFLNDKRASCGAPVP